MWAGKIETLHSIDQLQYYVFCIRLGVQCTIAMVLCLCNVGQCVLHAVLWSLIGMLMCLLAAEPRSIARLFFSFQYLCGTFLVKLYLTVWDWWDLRTGPMLSYWPKLLAPFLSSTVFTFYSSVLWVGIVGPYRVSIAFSRPYIADTFQKELKLGKI